MSGIDYHALEHAIPSLDAILTAALHDRRMGWSDRAVYSAVCDAVALSGACYATQRIALNLLRSELNIPDSIERTAQSRCSGPGRDEAAKMGQPTLTRAHASTSANNERRAA